ncbi:MAG TPA: hypothetical protein VM661_04420 [Candidatus Sulfotelmatobacter sp.]|jgi:hypothetical protein|nr:hypothetical protein [Candidatus Sulfotelmatobacter sp.]
MADEIFPDNRPKTPPSEEEPLLRQWTGQPDAKAIPVPLRIPSLAELERMLVILAMVNRWGDEDALPPVMN